MDRLADLDGNRVPASHDLAASYDAPSSALNVATGSLDARRTSPSSAAASSPVGSAMREMRSASAPPRRKREQGSSAAARKSHIRYGKVEPLGMASIGTGYRHPAPLPHEVAELRATASLALLDGVLARFAFRPSDGIPVPYEALAGALDACERHLETAPPNRDNLQRLKAYSAALGDDCRWAVSILRHARLGIVGIEGKEPGR